MDVVIPSGRSTFVSDTVICVLGSAFFIGKGIVIMCASLSSGSSSMLIFSLATVATFTVSLSVYENSAPSKVALPPVSLSHSSMFLVELSIIERLLPPIADQSGVAE